MSPTCDRCGCSLDFHPAFDWLKQILCELCYLEAVAEEQGIDPDEPVEEPLD